MLVIARTRTPSGASKSSALRRLRGVIFCRHCQWATSSSPQGLAAPGSRGACFHHVLHPVESDRRSFDPGATAFEINLPQRSRPGGRESRRGRCRCQAVALAAARVGRLGPANSVIAWDAANAWARRSASDAKSDQQHNDEQATRIDHKLARQELSCGEVVVEDHQGRQPGDRSRPEADDKGDTAEQFTDQRQAREQRRARQQKAIVRAAEW